METCFVPSWFLRIYIFHFRIHGNVFRNQLVTKNQRLRKRVYQLVSWKWVYMSQYTFFRIMKRWCFVCYCYCNANLCDLGTVTTIIIS
jgi:hypothetical protein